MAQHQYPENVRVEKKRIAVYCRVSTLSEEQDMSYETQCSYFQRLIEADPALTLAGIYGDHGSSGLSTEKRAEFQRLMADCMNGLVDEVWTKSISRFARNLADCITWVRRLREKHVAVVFEKEGINSMELNSEMILSVFAACAQAESSTQSTNIRWSYDRNNQHGTPSTRAAYGYRRAKDSKTNAWVIHEEEGRRIRVLFSMAARGCTFVEIVKALNGMEEEAGTGVKWSRHRVRYAILSEAYMGDYLSNKHYTVDCFDKKIKRNCGDVPQYYLEDHHEPLVDRETHALANRMLRIGALSSTVSEAYHRQLVAYGLQTAGERPITPAR